jgi:biopolymer transport protein ExbD
LSLPVRAGRELFAICGLLHLCGCAPAPPPLNIHVSSDGGATQCVAELDGRRIAPESLGTLARRWRRREVHITGTIDTPYRCVGAAIYALQRAGFSRIGFVSEPALSPTE